METKADVNWPADFHNADYKSWAAEKRDFSCALVEAVPARLHDRIAIRPVTYAKVTGRFVERREALMLAWAANCAPFRDLHITV